MTEPPPWHTGVMAQGTDESSFGNGRTVLSPGSNRKCTSDPPPSRTQLPTICVAGHVQGHCLQPFCHRSAPDRQELLAEPRILISV